MAKTTKTRLRATWLSVHKWIGLLLAVLIIPVSLTGSALVWSDSLDALFEPQRHEAVGPALHPTSFYARAAARELPSGERLSGLRFDAGGAPVVATALQSASDGRRGRTTLWIDPRDGRLIERSSGNRGLVQVMHVVHGSLMVPGWGRPIVGGVGVFMLISCLTGLWLWWPLNGNVRTGFRWKRRKTFNANLHYMTGFWVLVPLAMLSFTGAWISFPGLFSQFETRPPAGANLPAARAIPLEQPLTPIDAAVASARPFAAGPLASIAWPTDQKAVWRISFAAHAGNADVFVDDATGHASPPAPPAPATLARTMRRWHDGTGMGLGWQIMIFLGGIIPALLSITGLVIWWRARAPRQRARDARRLA